MPFTKPSPPAAVVAVPTPVPLRSDRANFAERGDAMMTWFPTGVDGVNLALSYFTDAADFVEQEANEAEASATAAEASNVAAAGNAAAAAASAGAALWVTGTNYPVPSAVVAGARVYSPTNQMTYVDTVGGLSSTDPASDTTGRWQSAMLPSAEAIALPDLLPTAYFNFAGGVIDRRLVQSRATPKTRRNIFGNVETVAAGIALPDFDPLTKRCLGYRSELGGSNLLLQSEDLTTSWTLSGSTVTANAVRAPDGNVTADKLVETAATAVHRAGQTVTAASGPFTYSVFLKAAERTVAFVVMTDNVTGGTGVRVNLSTGTLSADTAPVGSWTGVSSAIELMPDGFYRVSVSGVRGAGAQTYCYTILSNGVATSSQATYLGDGTSGLYVWGQQLETGLVPTSYIATGASAGTRGADKLALDLTAHAAILNPQEFTVVVAFKPGVVNSTNKCVFHLSDGTANNRTYCLLVDGLLRLQQVVGGVAYQTTLAASTARQVVAVTYTGLGVKMTLSGAGATALVGVPATVQMTQLALGDLGISAQFELNGHVELAAIYSRACTAGELRALVNNY